ncbi:MULTISPECIES: hypothetical protein [Streptomyces]|uniref:putative phage holin n=1 Tax=Streptomyces TaxID=1883 RepID=UPI001678BB1C|nr:MULTISPECIES: hypothetical protein [Streptomyces]WGP08859.1 hypothetical protein QFA72_03815 [Streptomyces sp. SH5]GGP66979.1 hypothetical protein GCM10010231_42290 [Streptomyces sindenensis]
MGTWDRLMNVITSAITASAGLTFMTTCHLLAPWWRTTTGRHLMAFGAAVTALSAYTVAITTWPDFWPLRLVRTLVVLAIAALFIQRTVMVIRAQRHQEH